MCCTHPSLACLGCATYYVPRGNYFRFWCVLVLAELSDSGYTDSTVVCIVSVCSHPQGLAVMPRRGVGIIQPPYTYLPRDILDHTYIAQECYL